MAASVPRSRTTRSCSSATVRSPPRSRTGSPPFECAFLRVARTARSAPRGRVHAIDELPELLPRTDVVILTVPLTDARFLASMPDRSLLVNLSRGAVVDTGALLTEVSAGRLHAALDVTDPEPLPAGPPLWNAPHTLIGRHVGDNSSACHPALSD